MLVIINGTFFLAHVIAAVLGVSSDAATIMASKSSTQLLLPLVYNVIIDHALTRSRVLKVLLAKI